MLVILIVILVFMAFEIGNILALYFKPELKFVNGVGVFNAWKRSKEEDPPMYDFANYLVKWVAGSKIIFVLLLAVILIMGSDLMQIVALGTLILSTLTFYLKLYPLIRKMDKNDQITPKKYSITLALMILSFILVFSGAFGYSLFVYLQA
ncbi:MAG: hypothetical protein ACTSQF_04730 [Candidatus Heimdallarchaeaceae archaeon]